jgi:predicted nucleic acid-binding protein
MSWINLGEVYCIVERAAGKREAASVVCDLRRILTMDLPTAERVLAAARIKARYRMAYADAFAVATSNAHHASLLTGDPEILDADPNWPTVDLRKDQQR